MGRFSDRPIKALFQESIGVGNPYLFVTVYGQRTRDSIVDL